MRADLGCPEGVGCEGLGDAVAGQVCIRPGRRSVAVEFGPVAVPGWGTVVGLCCVVVALTVAPNEKKLVDYIAGSLLVETEKDSVEALPLSKSGISTTV